MKYMSLLVLAVALFCAACEPARNDSSSGASRSEAESSKVVAPQQDQRVEMMKENDSVMSLKSTTEPVSLKDADSANVASQAFARKIIRNANLTVEVASATDSQRKIVSIAESHQGFVVTSEATQKNSGDRTKPEITVNLVVRVPAAQFNQVMEEIRSVGARVLQEKISGQDVTEEFMDLEARIKNQKALESQFLDIMKRAGKVDDALSVQRELAEVRTEIEKLEGRRRFLENQSSLSTINVSLQPPTQIVNTAGFGYSVRSAFADGMDAATNIVLFLIRAILALLPIIVLIVLPAALIAKLGVRVIRRRRPTTEPAAAAANE